MYNMTQTTRKNTLEILLSLFGLSDVDWNSDFADDGYTDWAGLDDLDEPLWFGAPKKTIRKNESAPLIRVVDRDAAKSRA